MIQIPSGFDWQHWFHRWERMQERYLVDRAERFAVMIRMVRATQSSISRVLDLGCGPGSLMRQFLEAFPEAQVTGVDLDPMLLLLGRAQLTEFGMRAKLIETDLRDSSWLQLAPGPFDAMVSSTALHWLAPEQLSALYGRVAQVLRPGGIFLNADHVGSDSSLIQQAWEQHRDEMLATQVTNADDWNSFWDAYAQALGVNRDEIHRRLEAAYEGGVEQGLSLPWHFHTLKASGFRFVDCFWRGDCDAVYGGIFDDGDKTRFTHHETRNT
ncbi:MAG: class I SAM-dependent methyltransferase [Chloroflexi bacterium]|nr:class I SAM-dependent methyltransferase [Chloroflexota bacterium]